MREEFDAHLVTEITRGMVAELAPQELPVFRAAGEAYLAGKDGTVAPRDQVLGFGVAEAGAFLTPVALAVIGEVVPFLIGQVKQAFEKESTNAIQEMVKNLFKKFRPPEKKAPVTLTAQQLKEVHRIALAKAHAMKLSDARAAQLADAIVSDLAT
jgi:hypothetical protein